MSSGLDIKWEWQGGPPSVASHAATWARLEIRLGASVCATRVEDLDRRANRDGIYGPLMPLAEWVVSNWWFVSNEPYEGHVFVPARRADPSRHAWYSRHNTLFAREGFALPDLTLAAVDRESALVGVGPDDGPSGRYPVQFLDQGMVLIPAITLREQLTALVNAVVGQLDGVDAPDANELRERWTFVQAVSGDERDARMHAAALGLDLDDDGPLDATVMQTVIQSTAKLNDDLAVDVLGGLDATRAAAEAERVVATRKWMNVASEDLNGLRSKVRDARDAARFEGVPAYEMGWRLAAVVRDAVLGGDPELHGAALDSALASVLSVRETPLLEKAFVRGLAVTQKDHIAIATQPLTRPNARFLAARALALPLLGGRERAITDARTWAQAVSRAFAAELVAPRAAVASTLPGSVVSPDDVRAIALRLGAPEAAVQHQIENHDLAVLE